MSTSVDLTLRQVAAIDDFTEVLRAAETVTTSRGGSREARLDTARRLDVLRRQHAAVVASTHRGLQEPGLRPSDGRVLVAHRNGWFRDRVAEALQEQGLTVLARLENAADAVGTAVAEQPDLALLEDPLPMMTTQAVVEELLRWSPRTFLAVQTADSRNADTLQAWGVRTVFGRQVPPADVACGLAAALLAPRAMEPAH